MLWHDARCVCFLAQPRAKIFVGGQELVTDAVRYTVKQQIQELKKQRREAREAREAAAAAAAAGTAGPKLEQSHPDSAGLGNPQPGYQQAGSDGHNPLGFVVGPQKSHQPVPAVPSAQVVSKAPWADGGFDGGASQFVPPRAPGEWVIPGANANPTGWVPTEQYGISNAAEMERVPSITMMDAED
jgi:hypothetical protein